LDSPFFGAGWRAVCKFRGIFLGFATAYLTRGAQRRRTALILAMFFPPTCLKWTAAGFVFRVTRLGVRLG